MELMLNEHYWRTTFGALEYDPDVHIQVSDNTTVCGDSVIGGQTDEDHQSWSQTSFRNYLETKVKFREAVTINDPTTLNAIHLTYRLQYLKDTAMARFIDETSVHTITQLITSN